MGAIIYNATSPPITTNIPTISTILIGSLRNNQEKTTNTTKPIAIVGATSDKEPILTAYIKGNHCKIVREKPKTQDLHLRTVWPFQAI